MTPLAEALARLSELLPGLIRTDDKRFDLHHKRWDCWDPLVYGDTPMASIDQMRLEYALRGEIEARDWAWMVGCKRDGFYSAGIFVEESGQWHTAEASPPALALALALIDALKEPTP